MSDKHLTDVSFKSLNLAQSLLQGIEDSGFSYCTPIQAETLPVVLSGKDVAGQAQTGTGKTAAFLIAAFQHLLKKDTQSMEAGRQPRVIILAPTRELAVQIHNDAENIGRNLPFRYGLAYGGTGYDSQRKTIEEGIDFLIGTPGRIIDYFKQHVFNLKQIEVVVLDEADRMFDLGFIKDIRFLLRRMPPPEQRLSMLFSATLSYRVQELAYEHMNNPQKVEIEPEQVTAEQIVESVYYPAKEEKIPLLLGLLNSKPVSRMVIFANTKRVVEKVGAYLMGNGHKVALLSGDVPQNKRLRLLKEFTDGELSILVATDVAARGLHIPDVTHVINYDLPQQAEDYVHRIGRTARAGAKGEAISFACDEYVFSIPEIEEYIGHKIPMESINAEMLVEPQPPAKIERHFPGKKHGKGHKHKSDGGKGRRKPGRKHHGPKPQPTSG
ncbi:MAG: ATP-dependent RNA helicase RhlB [Gammaproteobacteria bacterium]|nr:ATP-dependent RNA helicase RhlB [Gammaproteobacteria bacterium]MDH5654015.1 ATP-dependent RNA helicase RhlB [Gammaproteobacteria bacterium]